MVAPRAVEYWPAEHAAHTTEPAMAANVPATHAEQLVAPAVEKVPALQLAHEEPMTLAAGIRMASDTLGDSA